MRPSCHLAADVLVMIEPHVQPGITTQELNDICHAYIVEHHAYPSPLNYHGFPKSICTSPPGFPSARTGRLPGPRGEHFAGPSGMVRPRASPRANSGPGLLPARKATLPRPPHQTVPLPGPEDSLPRRTGGMIGSLLRLIRGAAIQAILDGTEKITRTALDSIGIDIASETAGTGRRRPGAPRGDT